MTAVAVGPTARGPWYCIVTTLSYCIGIALAEAAGVGSLVDYRAQSFMAENIAWRSVRGTRRLVAAVAAARGESEHVNGFEMVGSGRLKR